MLYTKFTHCSCGPTFWNYVLRLQYGQDRNAYTTVLVAAAVSSHGMLKSGSAVITTKYCHLASHSVNSLHQSSCWNPSMFLDFVLLGVINKWKRSCTFDLWGILSQYKPPSSGVNSTLVNSQSDRTSLSRGQGKSHHMISRMLFLSFSLQQTDGKKK